MVTNNNDNIYIKYNYDNNVYYIRITNCCNDHMKSNYSIG